MLSLFLLLSLSINNVLSVTLDGPIDDDTETSQKHRPHLQCLNKPGYTYPTDIRFNYSTITPGSIGLLFFGHMGSGKSRVVERVMLLKPKTIASARYNLNKMGVTQKATRYDRRVKDVQIHAIDTVGFCDGTIQGRMNIVKAILRIPAKISKHNINLKRIYFVTDIAENNLCFMEGNLNFLKLAYGEQAGSQICFLLNCCDKIDDEPKSHFDMVEQKLRELYEKVFPGHPNGFKVLFISATMCPGQLFDDIRMAHQDPNIVLGDPEEARIYLELPSLIQSLGQSLSDLQADLDVQREELEALESDKRSFESNLSLVKDKIREATTIWNDTNKDIQYQSKNLMNYELSWNYSFATNQWRLFDIIMDPNPNEKLYETILFDAQDKVALAQGPQDHRQMTAQQALEYAEGLLGKSNSDSQKFDIVQFTKAVCARIMEQSPETLESLISFDDVDQVLESRQRLYDSIGNGNAVRFRLNAHKYKGIYSDTYDLKRRAETCISDVKHLWRCLKNLYKKHVSATEEISKLKPKLTSFEKEIEAEKRIKADWEKKIKAKNEEIKELYEKAAFNGDLFKTKSDQLDTLKSQFKRFEMMLGHVVDTEDDAITSAANSPDNE